MTIYDRARDALNKANKGPWHTLEEACQVDGIETTSPEMIVSEEDPVHVMWNTDGAVEWAHNPDDVRLAALAPELAAEVVRLHEQFAALADDLHDAKVYDRADSSGQAWWVASRSAAARIRAALEGMEE